MICGLVSVLFIVTFEVLSNCNFLYCCQRTVLYHFMPVVRHGKFQFFSKWLVPDKHALEFSHLTHATWMVKVERWEVMAREMVDDPKSDYTEDDYGENYELLKDIIICSKNNHHQKLTTDWKEGIIGSDFKTLTMDEFVKFTMTFDLAMALEDAMNAVDPDNGRHPFDGALTVKARTANPELDAKWRDILAKVEAKVEEGERAEAEGNTDFVEEEVFKKLRTEKRYFLNRVLVLGVNEAFPNQSNPRGTSEKKANK